MPPVELMVAIMAVAGIVMGILLLLLVFIGVQILIKLEELLNYVRPGSGDKKGEVE